MRLQDVPSRKPPSRLFALSQETDYLFDIEILALAQQLGYRIAEVPINWAERPGSRLHLWRDAGKILSRITARPASPQAAAIGL